MVIFRNRHYEEIDREIYRGRDLRRQKKKKTTEKKIEIRSEKSHISATRPCCQQLLRRRRVHGFSHMQVWLCAFVQWGKIGDPLGRDVEQRKKLNSLYTRIADNKTVFFLSGRSYIKKKK